MITNTQQLKEQRTRRSVINERIPFITELLDRYRTGAIKGSGALDTTSQSRLAQYTDELEQLRDELPQVESKISELEPLAAKEPQLDIKELESDMVSLYKALAGAWSVADTLEHNYTLPGALYPHELLQAAFGVKRELSSLLNKAVMAHPKFAQRAKLKQRYE